MFISTDITGPLSANMYAYCENNPVNNSDPNGEFWHIVAGAIIGAAVNVATSYALNKLAGNEYSLADAAQDAIVGALSGGLAASGLGRLGQMIGNGIISAASTAYSSYKENGSVSLGQTLFSFGMGCLSGMYGGDGLTHQSNISKQVDIIGSNLHSIARSSSQNTIKRSLSYIAYEANNTFRRFVVCAVMNNTCSAIYNSVN